MQIKKNRLILLSCFFAFLLFCFANVQAQEDTTFSTQQLLEEQAAIIEPGVLPSSFWYWADIFGEELRFLFTVGREKKADYLIDIAAERLAEMRALSEQGISKYADDLLTKHENKVEVAERLYQKVRERGLQEAQELQADTERQILIQEGNLQQAARQAPEQYQERRDSLISRIGAGFRKILGHLSWKRGEIQEQRSEMFE